MSNSLENYKKKKRIVPTWFLFDLGMIRGDCAGNDFVFDWKVDKDGILMVWKRRESGVGLKRMFIFKNGGEGRFWKR